MEIENLGEIKNQMSKEKVFFVLTKRARAKKSPRFSRSDVKLETSLYKSTGYFLSDDPKLSILMSKNVEILDLKINSLHSER